MRKVSDSVNIKRDMTNYSGKQIARKLDAVFAMIRHRAENGDYSVDFELDMMDESMAEMLQKLGYKMELEEGLVPEDDFYTANW